MNKIKKIVFVSIFCLSLLFSLFIIIFDIFNYKIVDFFAPKTFEECQINRGDDPPTISEMFCYWDSAYHWLFGNFYQFFCHDEGEYQDPKCIYGYRNSNYIFPKNYEECSQEYDYKDENYCSVVISGYYERPSRAINYSSYNFKEIIKNCQKSYGFLIKNGGCRINFFTDKAYVPDVVEEDRNNTESNCIKLGGTETVLHPLGNNEYLYNCDFSYNSQKESKLFKQCVDKQNHTIYEGINNSMWCNYYYNFIIKIEPSKLPSAI